MDESQKMAEGGQLGPVNIPIQMIAATDTSGRMSPIRFRFEAEDHHIETVTIEKTVSRDESNYAGVREKRFICTAVVGEERRFMELRYHVGSQKWRIFQFLA